MTKELNITTETGSLAPGGIFRIVNETLVLDAALARLFGVRQATRATLACRTVLRALAPSSRRAVVHRLWDLRATASRAHDADSKSSADNMAMAKVLQAHLDETLELSVDIKKLSSPSQDRRRDKSSPAPKASGDWVNLCLRFSSIKPRANQRRHGTQARAAASGFHCEGLAFLSSEQNEALLTKGHIERSAELVQGEFLRRMSHELRTPLHVICGISDLLTHSTSPDAGPKDPVDRSGDRRLLMGQLAEAARQMEELVGQLLDFSYLKTAAITPVANVFDLSDVLVQSWQHYFPRAEEKRVHLVYEGNVPEGMRAVGDWRLITQLIEHLLSNAVKFTHVGKIVLRAEVSAGGPQTHRLLVTIKDTGVGISPDDAQRIFNAFEQAETGDSRTFGGAGLGLFLCRQIASALGSELRIVNESGFSSCFTFTLLLPYAHQQEATPPPSELDRFLEDARNTLHPKIQVATPVHNAVPLRILIVDDNEVNLQILKAMLRHYDCSVTFARDGLEAVREYSSATYDVILMDLQMPNMNGYEATRQIRILERAFSRPRTLVAAVSASCFSEDVTRARRAGCDDHIAKPVHRGELIKAFSRYGFALEKTQELASAPVVARPLYQNELRTF